MVINAVGIDVLRIYVFLALTSSFQSVLVESSQIMNNTKLTLGSLILGVIIKLILNVPMIHLFNFIGLQGYYGPTIASIISQLITIIFLLIKLNRKYQVNYGETIKIFGKDMKPDAYDIKSKIGVVFQEVSVFDELTVYENIDYFCGLYIKDKKTRNNTLKMQ